MLAQCAGGPAPASPVARTHSGATEVPMMEATPAAQPRIATQPSDAAQARSDDVLMVWLYLITVVLLFAVWTVLAIYLIAQPPAQSVPYPAPVY